MPQEKSTPLNTWLKVQLREAWERELNFKKVLHETFESCHQRLQSQTASLKTQLATVTCDLESW
jgi:hypothetical protein